MLKDEIKAVVEKIVARADAVHPDAAVIFFSYWRRDGTEDNYSTAAGDQNLIDRCLQELEPKIRLFERRNLNPSQKSLEDIYRVGKELAEKGDPEISKLFGEVSDLMVKRDYGQQSSPYFGEAILAIGWMELGITFHCYAEFSGMIRGVVTLFNAGIDSFRKIYGQQEERP